MGFFDSILPVIDPGGTFLGTYGNPAAEKAAEEATKAQVESTKIATAAQLEGQKAAIAEIKAGREASISESQRQFDLTRKDFSIFRKAAQKSLTTLFAELEKGPGEFEESAGYKFVLGEGQKAITTRAAAAGRRSSPQTTKELMRFGQGLASTEFDNFQARYRQKLEPFFRLAGFGAQGTGEGARLGTQLSGQNVAALTGAASQTANILQRGGELAGQNALLAGGARAGGFINAANIATNQQQNRNALLASAAGTAAKIIFA